jgi:hypothetical protein
MKTKTIWLMPFLWALFWASCTDDGEGGLPKKMTQQERDIRFGLAALATSMCAALLARELLKQASDKS